MTMKMHLIRIASFMLCLALLLGCMPAMAETSVARVRTNERGASFRSSPVMTADNSNKICGIHANVELDVFDAVNGWFQVSYNGQMGYVASEMVTIIGYNQQTAKPSGNSSAGYSSSRTGYSGAGNSTSGYSEEPYDMGVPYIGNAVYRQDQMNMAIFWVQTQLKATGIWYQGEVWDVTGNLGDHTMSEIASFMQSRGYGGHGGTVDQAVIDELADYMGYRLVPVYVGGFYEYMNCIMAGGSAGQMQKIYSNLIDMVPRVTTGARWIQVVLKKLGYYSGSIDGKYGEGTDAAVRKFQKSHSYQEREYVTLGVARSMLEEYYYSGWSLYDLP